jgi:hypothetical protein
MTIIGQLLEKWNEIEQGLEISEMVRYNESDDDEEEIIISPDEYKRVMQALETWLKSNPQFRKQKYLNKGIQSTEEYAYAYTFKKVGGIKKYIIIYRQRIL